jgi:hypothetical protein
MSRCAGAYAAHRFLDWAPTPPHRDPSHRDSGFPIRALGERLFARALGARVHVADGDDLGLATVPPPVELGDALAPADGRVWVVSALIELSKPGDALEALAEVEPDERPWRESASRARRSSSSTRYPASAP